VLLLELLLEDLPDSGEHGRPAGVGPLQSAGVISSPSQKSTSCRRWYAYTVGLDCVTDCAGHGSTCPVGPTRTRCSDQFASGRTSAYCSVRFENV
jgi:hypothetical protein